MNLTDAQIIEVLYYTAVGLGIGLGLLILILTVVNIYLSIQSKAPEHPRPKLTVVPSTKPDKPTKMYNHKGVQNEHDE